MDKKRYNFVLTTTGPMEIDDPAEIEAYVWGDIAEAFSKPVAADEPHIEYVPTQVLAEAFHRHGYDGIAYKSLLNGGGVNFALFDLEAADLMNCGLYEVRSVSFDFEQESLFPIGALPEAQGRTRRSGIVRGHKPPPE